MLCSDQKFINVGHKKFTFIRDCIFFKNRIEMDRNFKKRNCDDINYGHRLRDISCICVWRLLQHAVALRQLTHRNIATVYDAFSADSSITDSADPGGQVSSVSVYVVQVSWYWSLHESERDRRKRGNTQGLWMPTRYIPCHLAIYRVCTDPGKVWKMFWKFSRPWKVWKMIIGLEKYGKILEKYGNDSW